MAFARKGKQNKKEVEAKNSIKILNIPTEKEIKASLNNKEEQIICPHCKKVIGMKMGDVFAIMDQRYVSLANQACPICKKDLR